MRLLSRSYRVPLMQRQDTLLITFTNRLPSRWHTPRTGIAYLCYSVLAFLVLRIARFWVFTADLPHPPSIRSEDQAQTSSRAATISRYLPYIHRYRGYSLPHGDASLDWGDGDITQYDTRIGKQHIETPDTFPGWLASSSIVRLVQGYRRPRPKSRLKGLIPEPEKHHLPEAQSLQTANHTFRPDGLLEVNPYGRHPILDLIRTSELKWERKLEASSKTLEEAVTEYRRRYRRMPPKGFDKWWDYATKHNVQLPDEFDQIHHDLEPFWGFRASVLTARQQEWEQTQELGSYTIGSQDGRIVFRGHSLPKAEEHIALDRANAQMGLLAEVAQWLPDFNATFTAHDVPYQFIGHDMRSEATEKGAMSEYLDGTTLFQTHHRGWAEACADASALRQLKGALATESSKTFIWDHKLSMDPCTHIDHVRLNGFFISHGEGPVPRKQMVPAFSMCTTQMHSDILTVAMEMWTEDIGVDPPWHEKKHDQLLWRGSNTGIYFGDHNRWMDSQRVRLVNTTNLKTGSVSILNSTEGDEAVGAPERIPFDVANRAFMDIGFSGKTIQCAPELCKLIKRDLAHKTSQSFEAAQQWKYILDVDGNGWSARFKRLMTSRSLIFKSTIFPEWYSDRVQPWVHYVPIQNDLSDLYDTFAFFHGNVNGHGGHDDLAERIATQGRSWSLNFWRKEDMIAYMFRLMLEYARVMSPDREAQTFEWANAPNVTAN